MSSTLGVSAGTRAAIKRRNVDKQFIPLGPTAGLSYMKSKQILSVNPQSSGGVGIMHRYCASRTQHVPTGVNIWTGLWQ